MKKFLLQCLVLFSGPIVFTSVLFGQVETGLIVGSISDPSGAVIPSASISIKSEATALSSTVQSNEAGRFQSAPLKPGDYQVSVTAPGFKNSIVDVRVDVNARLNVDVQLEVGRATEHVTVEASAVQVESETSMLGNIRPERAVAELPLNARNFATLISCHQARRLHSIAIRADYPARHDATWRYKRFGERCPSDKRFCWGVQGQVCCGAVTRPTEQQLQRFCPHCEKQNVLKNGRDRRGAQVSRCADCRRSFTALTGTPFLGHSFPPAVISLAVRWYLRFRLSDADVVEWLAERHIQVDTSTVFDGVQKFAPLYQDASKAYRHRVGQCWSVDETDVKMAGRWGYVYRALDECGPVIELLFREHRDTEATVAFFRAAQGISVSSIRLNQRRPLVLTK